jgi:uncharacterized protein
LTDKISAMNEMTVPEHKSTDERIEQAVEYLKNFNSMLVAYSGGVDSSTLAALAHLALGDRCVAVTVDSQSLPARELESLKDTAKSLGTRHIIIPYNELEEPGFSNNPVDRCYHCKNGLFRELKKLARELGLEVVAEGTNASELTGHRPGHKATIENEILTPFADLGIGKNEIRKMAKHLGLPIWDKPQLACLSSRFPYGRTITVQGLRKVEKAEDYLFDLGINQCRVRDHEETARIEVPVDDFHIILKHRDDILGAFKELGYNYITLDLEGFRSGSFDIATKAGTWTV